MILVVGGNGMLGTDLLELWDGKARGIDLPDLDITDPASVRKTILAVKPEVVVNCAAFTDVDRCEEVEDAAFAVNATGVGHLAEASAAIGAPLVHVSTDYVFDGRAAVPYGEDAPVAPLSAYGRTKLAGECEARKYPDHLIVRTQWLYGRNGKNFVETMIRLGGEREEVAVVADQTGSPTWTADLAQAIDTLLRHRCRGTYHAVSSGSCTWHRFAERIFEVEGLASRVRAITTAELGRRAQRPAYSVLDTGKFRRDTGSTLPSWDEALQRYLRERRHHGAG